MKARHAAIFYVDEKSVIEHAVPVIFTSPPGRARAANSDPVDPALESRSSHHTEYRRVWGRI